jgi:uncharacterized Zn-binding protein involved in type VI secretion
MAGLPTLRLGDGNIATGLLFQGSMNVLTNGRPTARMLDMMTPHRSGVKKPPMHPPNPLLLGSFTVLVNGRPTSQMIKSLETLKMLPHPWIGTGALSVLTGG